MRTDTRDKVHRVNCLANDLEALYHQAALKFGLSDSVLFVLYMLHEKGGNCLLYDICCASGISKQTINSAIRKLENDKMIYLEQDKGKTKRVRVTDKGQAYITQTASRLFEAECNAFQDWTEDEIELYLTLMEKYNLSFRAEIEKIEREQ